MTVPKQVALLHLCALQLTKPLSQGTQQRPEAIKLLLGFLGTEHQAGRIDSWFLAARLDNEGIQEPPRLRVSEGKQ